MYRFYKRRPGCNLAYFADNYNIPYGNRAESDILGRVDQIFEKIALLNPSAAVVACNTVTALCIGSLRRKYDFPIIGIQPAVKPAVKAAKRCLLLATPATVNSGAVRELIKRYGNGRVVPAPCPDLAAYVENNIFEICAEEVEALLPPAECDGVVLGCTHYSFVSDIISAHYNCEVYDGAEGTVNQICKILGISDHQGFCPQEVAFYGGNCLKNANIFNILKNS